ncbi:MAG: hypothetical protein HRT64_12710 [Erythrobacter sp.]|nr:hypothetical protein [Erythrobacter sp.]
MISDLMFYLISCTGTALFIIFSVDARDKSSKIVWAWCAVIWFLNASAIRVENKIEKALADKIVIVDELDAEQVEVAE